MKLIIGIAIGFVATYLYFNPGDWDGVIDTAKTGINKGASVVKELTDSK